MEKCLCNHSHEEIKKIADNYQPGKYSNISMHKCADGKEILTFHKGEGCICMYELFDGKWRNIPPMHDF